jgi:uncharacterized coiled-coil DUF342 family protein
MEIPILRSETPRAPLIAGKLQELKEEVDSKKSEYRKANTEVKKLKGLLFF